MTTINHVELARRNCEIVREVAKDPSAFLLGPITDIPRFIDFVVDALGGDRPTLLAMVRCGELQSILMNG